MVYFYRTDDENEERPRDKQATEWRQLSLALLRLRNCFKNRACIRVEPPAELELLNDGHV